MYLKDTMTREKERPRKNSAPLPMATRPKAIAGSPPQVAGTKVLEPPAASQACQQKVDKQQGSQDQPTPYNGTCARQTATLPVAPQPQRHLQKLLKVASYGGGVLTPTFFIV